MIKLTALILVTAAGASGSVESASSLNEAILMQPLWLQLWVGWLVLINIGGGLVFIRRPEAKWVLLAMIGNVILMNWLFAQFGYQRILGIAHVIFWTPLIVYLWARRQQWQVGTLGGKWLAVLFATNTVSLLIDYTDVVRYLLGERL